MSTRHWIPTSTSATPWRPSRSGRPSRRDPRTLNFALQGPRSSSFSRHPIFWLRHLSAFALHDLIERGKVRAIAPLGEKRGGVHSSELLRYRSCHELVDAGAIGLGAPHDFGLH